MTPAPRPEAVTQSRVTASESSETQAAGKQETDSARATERIVEMASLQKKLDANRMNVLREILQKVKQTVGQLQGPTILICSSTIRFSLRQIVENELPLLAVLSHGEMPPQVKIVSLGVIR